MRTKDELFRAAQREIASRRQYAVMQAENARRSVALRKKKQEIALLRKKKPPAFLPGACALFYSSSNAPVYN